MLFEDATEEYAHCSNPMTYEHLENESDEETNEQNFILFTNLKKENNHFRRNFLKYFHNSWSLSKYLYFIRLSLYLLWLKLTIASLLNINNVKF